MSIIPIAQSRTIREGQSVAILSFGSVLEVARDVAEDINATLLDMRFIKPLDEERLIEIEKKYDVVFTIEESVIDGGAGSAVNEFLLGRGTEIFIFNYGLPDKLLAHGSREDMLVEAGLDAKAFRTFIDSKLKSIKI